MIVAVAKNGVIGIDGRIPWHHPADLKRFKQVTTGHTIIMGRRTYESIGRPLPNRRNIVVTRATIPGIECAKSLAEALARVEGDAWIVGGAQMYEEGLRLADVIDVTTVPDEVPLTPDAVRFPAIGPEFEAEAAIPMEGGLFRRIYRRKP